MAVMSWMAMLFYLPRLFVYHAENADNEAFIKVAKIQEAKLYNFIGKPAMIATVLSGVIMIALNPAVFFGGGWMHAKIAFVVLLLLYHVDCGRYVRLFRNDSCTKTGKFFRFYNEIPTLLMIGIVIFVVVKPF